MTEVDLGFVHRFVPGQPGESRTVLLLHGTGGDENDLIPLGQALLPGAALLSPRGRVLEQGMPRFFRRLAEGVFDEPDIRRQTAGLADFIDHASAVYQFDRERVVAVGFSNGANIAAALLLLRPQPVQQAVLIRAMVPLVPESVAELHAVRVLLLSGRADPLMAPAQAEQLATLLAAGGADVTLHWENAGHQLTPGDVAVAQVWLAADGSGRSA